MKSSNLIRLSRLIICLAIAVFCSLTFLEIWSVSNLVINPDKQPIVKFHTSVIRMKSDVYLELKEDKLRSDNMLLQKVQRNKALFVCLRCIVVGAIIIAVLYQLKAIISSFSKESLFSPQNRKPVRIISYLLMTWILADLIFYMCIPLFIPRAVISNTYNFWAIEGSFFNIIVGIFSLLASINYGVLLSACAFYIISMVFKEGNLLKEQTDLTI